MLGQEVAKKWQVPRRQGADAQVLGVRASMEKKSASRVRYPAWVRPSRYGTGVYPVELSSHSGRTFPFNWNLAELRWTFVSDFRSLDFVL